MNPLLKLRLLDLPYPNRCDCCYERIPYDQLLCPSCMAALEEERISYADWAADQSAQPWDSGAVLYSYRDTARNGILSMKEGDRGFARYAGQKLAETIRAACDPETISFVTWVPVTRRRRLSQGYAHAENLGKALAKSLGVPTRRDLLTERQGALRQHDLPSDARSLYAQRFQYSGGSLEGKRILLVDDVLTTGSTLRRCTDLLLDAGAESVGIATACARVLEKKVSSDAAVI